MKLGLRGALALLAAALVAAAAVAVAAVTGGGSAGPPGAPAAAAPFGTPVTAVGPGGVRIHAWVSAARRRAPTLIVINGGPGLSHAAAPPAGVLAPQFRVVVYDQRGTGLSRTTGPAAFDLAHQAGDVEALRRRLGAARVDLLGHSWGGRIAAAYAARYPQRVGALVLVDAEPVSAAAAGRGSALLMARLGTLTAHGVIPAQLPALDGDDCTAALNALAPAYVANPRLRVPPMPPGTCSETISTQTVDAQTPAVLRAVSAGLRRYRGPALVIFGREDPFRPAFEPADLAELASARPRLTVLPHAGHMPWLESRRFFADVRRFLAAAG